MVMVKETIAAMMDALEEARIAAKARADKGSYEIAWGLLNASLEDLIRETRARLEPPRESQ